MIASKVRIPKVWMQRGVQALGGMLGLAFVLSVVLFVRVELAAAALEDSQASLDRASEMLGSIAGVNGSE